MITILILSIWFIGSVLAYFTNRYFMIKFLNSLSNKLPYTNSDMLFNIFISILGSWITMIMVALSNINLFNNYFNEWLSKKSK